MNHRSLGWVVMGAGLVALAVGALLWAGGLAWFGRLPGDLRIEGQRTRVYFPITSMLLVSAVLSVIWTLIRRLRP